jgi:hypothetical protein
MAMEMQIAMEMEMMEEDKNTPSQCVSHYPALGWLSACIAC